MKSALPVITLALAALSGCTSPGAELLVPQDIEVDWDARFDGSDDGVGALIPVDVMVYEADSGLPLGDVQLHVQPTAGAAHVLHPEEAHRLAPELDDELFAFWDVWEGSRVAFEPSLRQLEPDLAVATDDNGLARAMVWVDAFGLAADGAPAPLPILVTATSADGSSEMTETFSLIPR